MIDPDHEARAAAPADDAPEAGGTRRPAGSLVSYLAPSGRVSRWTFLVAFAAPCIGLALGLSGVVARSSIAGFAVFLALYWAFTAGLAKRLHDLGLPGLPVAAVLAVGLWLQLESGLELPAWLQTYIYLLFGAGVLFAASTSGEPRANRYGPVPPLRGSR